MMPQYERGERDYSFILFGLFLVVNLIIFLALLHYNFVWVRAKNTEACLQQLGYTSTQCELIISSRVHVENCMRHFDYSQEQCEFIVFFGGQVEDCIRLFEYTREQCELLIRIKPQPVD